MKSIELKKIKPVANEMIFIAPCGIFPLPMKINVKISAGMIVKKVNAVFFKIKTSPLSYLSLYLMFMLKMFLIIKVKQVIVLILYLIFT